MLNISNIMSSSSIVNRNYKLTPQMSSVMAKPVTPNGVGVKRERDDSDAKNSSGAFHPSPHPERIHVIKLTDEQKANLLKKALKVPSPYDNFKKHTAASRKAVASTLDEDTLLELDDFKCESKSASAILLRNLPTDPVLPNTPKDGLRSADKTTFVSEACLTGVSVLVGSIYGYSTEKKGELIHNICPVPRGEKEQSNESSKIDLSLHVENSYFSFRPDYLSLVCLRQDHEKTARTSVADARAALRNLSPKEIERLQEPVFEIPSPASHHDAQKGEQWSQPRPLLSGPTDCPQLSLHLPDMRCTSTDAQVTDAFNKFKVSINSCVESFALEPGDMVIINNRKAAHGRSFFTPRYDGKDRWLQRVYLSSDLFPARVFETDRSRIYNEKISE